MTCRPTSRAGPSTVPMGAPRAELVAQILDDLHFTAPYADRDGDIALAAATIVQLLRSVGALRVVERAEMVDAVFYRGKGAYVVGRLLSGSHRLPFVLALRHEDDGLALDAVLLDENDVSILFSFAHSYFHVDVERPYDLVRFRKSIMPRKRIAELYIGIGYNNTARPSCTGYSSPSGDQPTCSR